MDGHGYIFQLFWDRVVVEPCKIKDVRKVYFCFCASLESYYIIDNNDNLHQKIGSGEFKLIETDIKSISHANFMLTTDHQLYAFGMSNRLVSYNVRKLSEHTDEYITFENKVWQASYWPSDNIMINETRILSEVWHNYYLCY